MRMCPKPKDWYLYKKKKKCLCVCACAHVCIFVYVRVHAHTAYVSGGFYVLSGKGFVTRLELFHIGPVSWPVSLKDSDCLSLPFHHCWDCRLITTPGFYMGSGNWPRDIMLEMKSLCWPSYLPGFCDRSEILDTETDVTHLSALLPDS